MAGESSLPYLQYLGRVRQIVGGIVEEDVSQSCSYDRAEDDIDVERAHPLFGETLTLPNSLLDHRP